MESKESTAKKARQIYNERFKKELEANAFGQFVAIEIESKEYFLGETPLKAVKKGKQKYATKQFHVMKIGYNTAFLMKGVNP